MDTDPSAERRISRRRLQALALALPAPIAAAVLTGKGAGTQSSPTAEVNGTPTLAPTPTCLDADDLETTLEETEGPFYTPDSPERTSLLEDGMTGTVLLLSGYVYASSCQPVGNALIDF